MPTYQYECDGCGHTFEAFQSMTEGKFRKCPSCKALKLKRLIGSGSGVIFKGSGFYETDYKRKPAPAETCPKTPSGKKDESCASCPAAAS